MIKSMNIKCLGLIFGYFALISSLILVSLTSAQTRQPATQPQSPLSVPKPTAPVSPAKPGGLADLMVKSIKVKSPLLEGDKVEGSVTISIANQGTGAAAAGEVKISCSPVQSKGPAIAFMQQMSQGQLISIPGIQPGATETIVWPGHTAETWLAGIYKIIVEADISKKALESNEANNLGQAQFQVSEKATLIRKGELGKGVMPLVPLEAKTKPTDETSSGVGKRNITGVDFASAPNTGTGKREIKGVDFTAVSNIGTGKREITGVDFTAAPNLGTGKREISGVDFTAAPNIGTGKREITGADFTAAPSTGTGKREITGVNFTVLPPVAE